MRKRAVLIIAVSCAASGPPAQTVSSGPWRATFRDWSGFDVCATEPSWLLDELDEANGVLEKLTARGGAWPDDELPALEAATRALPPLVDAHGKNLAALARCPYAQGDVYRAAMEKGTRLVAAARAELDGAAKLLRFSQHRRELEKWRKGLEAERDVARDRCSADAGAEPVAYFAYADELDGTTWFFCDGAVVNAPLSGPLELVASPESWPAARVKDQRAACFQAARVYPGGLIKQPPR